MQGAAPQGSQQNMPQGAAPQGPQQGMPQGQQGMPMPPANDPSMSAAMDLATDELDALGLDPRTKAMLKTQEAYDLMQSAQRELAMAQQQPVPPTIEGQRTQQTMQGISALTQQLSPGIRQRGQQMAMAQRSAPMQGQRPPMQGQQMAMAQRRPPMQGQRPPMQGQRPPTPQQRPPMQGQRPPMPQQGMAGMPARNMQGMTRGGVVGYAGPDGSQVQAPQRPIAGQPSAAVPDQAALVAQFLASYSNLQADLKAAKPQEKDLFQRRVQDLINTTPPSVVNAAFGQGMARGGIVRFDGRDGSQVQGLTPAMQREVEKIELETQDAGAVSLDQRELMAASLARVAEQRARAAERDVRSPDNELFNIKTGLLNKGYSQKEIERIISAGPQFETTNPQTGPFPPSLIDGNRTGIMSGGGGGNDTFDPVVGVDTSGGAGAETVTRQGLLTQAQNVARESLPIANATPNISPEILEAMQARALADATTAGSDARKVEQGLASQAYAMSPEMKAAYARQQQESDAAYAAQLDPKRLKDQKFNAVLAGLAAPGGIARGGIEALQGVTAVGDTAAELRRKQSEERFGSAKEREGINREGKIKGYEAGRSANDIAYERTSAGANAAFQALSNIDIGAQNRENANRIAKQRVELETISMQLRSLDNQANMASRDKNTQARILSDAQRAAGALRTEISKAIAESAFMTEEKKKPYNDFIATTQAQLAAVQDQINFAAAQIGYDLNKAVDDGKGGNTDIVAQARADLLE